MLLQPFFVAMHRALKPGGVISTQVHPTKVQRVDAIFCQGSLSSVLLMALFMWRVCPDCSLLCCGFGCYLPSLAVAAQGESLWLHMDIIKTLAAMCREVFVDGTVSYAYTTIPTYPR